MSVLAALTQHILRIAEFVNQDIVHNTTLAVGHCSVLHLAVIELRHIVRGDVLQQVESLLSLNPYFAHVAHIKDAGLLAHCNVFIVDTRELDGHIVTRKLRHFGTVGDMVLGTSCCFHTYIPILILTCFE